MTAGLHAGLVPAIDAGWTARLELAFERRAHATVLAHVRHEGPLTVQRPLYPEGRDACHAVIVHPPGGLAAGDALDVAVDVRAGAHAVLTMPGAAKFYRCDARPSRQSIVVRAGAGAVVEWLPPETIVFDGASARSTLEIDASAQAGAIAWDIVALGRRARGESFARGRWRQRLSIRRDGVALLDDVLDVAGGDRLLRSRIGLAGRCVVATMVALGRGVDAALVASCRDAVGDAAHAGVTMPVPGLLVVRCLADEAEAVRGLFGAVWRRVRPALAGVDAKPLRLWAT
jgi:urease accessory protein